MSATRIEFATPDANSADGIVVIDDLDDARTVASILTKNGYLMNLQGFTRPEVD